MTSTPENMTFGEHLEVLRRMLLRTLAVSVCLGCVIFGFKDTVWSFLLAPSQSHFMVYDTIRHVLAMTHSSVTLNDFQVQLISTELSSQFMLHMSTSFYLGLLLASPYILTELFRFVSPALYQRERKVAIVTLVCVYVLFLIGLITNYFILFPLVFRFLGTYQVSETIVNTITLQSYVSNFITLSLVMGCIFQMPVLAFFAGRYGLVTADTLGHYRKAALLGTVVLSAIITPPDIFSCILVVFPLYALYELSIKIVKYTSPRAAQ